jgi:GTP cyclohydrolase II
VPRFFKTGSAINDLEQRRDSYDGVGGASIRRSGLNSSFGAATVASMVAVDRAAADLRRGGFVVIEGPGEAVLAQAAETVTNESLAKLGRLGNGATRLALTANRARVLDLSAAGSRVVVLPVANGIDSGAIRWLADPTCIGRPPLPCAMRLERAEEGGCLAAAIGLSKLAQLLPAAVCIPLSEGTRAEEDAILGGGDLLRVSVGAIADYPRLVAETLRPVSEARLPLAAAENGRIMGFRPADGSVEQFAILIGEPAANQPVLCRLHSECFTGDLLGSLRCDCGPQLQRALRLMGQAGHGVLLYLAHEGRGIGLINKLRAYQLQDDGFDTLDANQHLGFEPDERSYRAAAIMLGHLGVRRVRLLTNNPRKVAALIEEGIEVTERVPHALPANPHNRAYLSAKATRAGHLLESEG